MSEQVSEPYFRFGEGKISGWISVTLGGLSVLGVLCFQFPDFLTTPQLRQAYTVDQMRWLLGGGMIFSAAWVKSLRSVIDPNLSSDKIATELPEGSAPS